VKGRAIIPEGPIEVLLVDGDNRAGLAVSRSLARHGVSFLLITGDAQGIASCSRSVKHSMLAPCRPAKGDEYVEFLVETIRRHGIQLAIPVTDQALRLFERYRSVLAAETRLAMANSQAVRSVLDKRINLEVAKRVGVPCPREFELQDPAQIPEMIQMLGVPVVLKNPGDSPEADGAGFKFRVLYAHSEEEVRSHIEKHCANGKYPLFQECAVGTVHNLCCFAAQGELIAVHEYHSVRRNEGVGVLRKIVAPLPDLVEHASQLLRALDWDGVAHVAFFIGHDGQKKWYMETNGRFWASTEGSVHAGWDFPYWVYRYFRHGEKPVPEEIKLGSMTCWHCGDLLALLDYFRGGPPPATGTSPGKVRATLQYLSGFAPGIHSDVFHWNDPMPGLVENWKMIAKSWQFMRGKAAQPVATVPAKGGVPRG